MADGWRLVAVRGRSGRQPPAASHQPRATVAPSRPAGRAGGQVTGGRDGVAAAPRSARVAVAAFFALAGIAFGSWVSRIPEVKEKLGLDPGQLGLALLGMAVGAVVAMPTTGWLIARWGSRRVCETAGILACLTLLLPVLAPSGPALFVALMLFGSAYGVMDVSMNTQAAAVEALYARPIMSSFHGVFSVGGLVGAATAGLVTGLGVAPVPHLAAVAALLLVVALLARRDLLSPSGEGHDGGPAFARPNRALAGVAAIAFCVLLAEGAVSDWSAVYLTSVVGTAASVAAAGFAAFSVTMAAGRFAGDGLALRFGPAGVVRIGGVLTALGLALALLVRQPVPAIAGFLLVGAGLAGAFPIALSAAGRTPGFAPGTAIAAVATTGYCGFLVGPPSIGFVAHLAGLPAGLGLVALLAVAMVLLANTVEGAPEPSSAAAGACARAAEDLA